MMLSLVTSKRSGACCQRATQGCLGLVVVVPPTAGQHGKERKGKKRKAARVAEDQVMLLVLTV
jgi:hypothetical protein